MQTFEIFPKFTTEQAVVIKATMERKAHLEYLCFMMLDALNTNCDLKRLFQFGVKQNRIEKEVLCEFFGDPKKDENAGCSGAEGHTVQSLIAEWRSVTESMMSQMRSNA